MHHQVVDKNGKNYVSRVTRGLARFLLKYKATLAKELCKSVTTLAFTQLRNFGQKRPKHTYVIP